MYGSTSSHFQEKLGISQKNFTLSPLQIVLGWSKTMDWRVHCIDLCVERVNFKLEVLNFTDFSFYFH